jgi:CheY-like chemotaxis protein
MTTGQQQRILVADDDPSIRASLEALLTKAGYQVTLARDGAEAVRLWRELGADLVIMDLFMPEQDGIEAILQLRKQNRAIRIIAMSGGGATHRFDLLKEIKLLGAMQTIEKPFTMVDMMVMVTRALKEVH